MGRLSLPGYGMPTFSLLNGAWASEGCANVKLATAVHAAIVSAANIRFIRSTSCDIDGITTSMGPLYAGGPEDLFFEELPDPIDDGHEFRGSLHREGPRPRQIDIDDLLDPSRPRSEHDDAIGQQ